jgi:hypothetical protein
MNRIPKRPLTPAERARLAMEAARLEVLAQFVGVPAALALLMHARHGRRMPFGIMAGGAR